MEASSYRHLKDNDCCSCLVIPAQAGIPLCRVLEKLDSSFRWDDELYESNFPRKSSTAFENTAFSSPATMCVARGTRTCSACGTSCRNSAMVASETLSLFSPLITSVGRPM